MNFLKCFNFVRGRGSEFVFQILWVISIILIRINFRDRGKIAPGRVIIGNAVLVEKIQFK